jgi:hypothetical protein
LQSWRASNNLLPPLFKTKADVIEPNAVGIKTFATRSEYSNKLRNEVDYLTELGLLFADLVFRPLAIFDVGDDAILFDDVAGFFSQRHAPHRVPAVFSICSTDGSFVLEVFSTHEAGPPLSDDPIDVLKVNESRPLRPGYVVKRGAQVVQPRPIEVFDAAVRPGCVNQRRDRIDEQLNIQRLGLLFCRGHGGNNTPGESGYLLDRDDCTDKSWRGAHIPLPPTNHRELTVAHILHFERPCEGESHPAL